VSEGDFLAVVRDIVSAAGYPDAAIGIRPTDRTKTAAASIENGQKTIQFNPTFIAQISQVAGTGWAAVLVLAHEIAHLLAGHAAPRGLSRDELRRMELEAHHATGVLLARLGATLAESTKSLRAACRLDDTDEAFCAACEEAVGAGWRTHKK
jgi:hypothetical protein